MQPRLYLFNPLEKQEALKEDRKWHEEVRRSDFCGKAEPDRVKQQRTT